MRRKSTIRQEVLQLPLFLLIFGLFSASMIIPAIYGVVTRDLLASRAFLYAGLLGLFAFFYGSKEAL
jgi:trk system potassium uptake protein TrkH